MILYLKSIFVFMPKIMVTELINLVVLYKPRDILENVIMMKQNTQNQKSFI